MNTFSILFKLPLHHIGYIIDKKEIIKFEKNYKKKFVFDRIQGVRVLFVKSKLKNFFTEYIVKEGKSKNQKKGFNHLCFNLKNLIHLKSIDKKIKDERIGYPLSKLVKSGSKECNKIKFYYFKNVGLIEFNILK